MLPNDTCTYEVHIFWSIYKYYKHLYMKYVRVLNLNNTLYTFKICTNIYFFVVGLPKRKKKINYGN